MDSKPSKTYSMPPHQLSAFNVTTGKPTPRNISSYAIFTRRTSVSRTCGCGLTWQPTLFLHFRPSTTCLLFPLVTWNYHQHQPYCEVAPWPRCRRTLQWMRVRSWSSWSLCCPQGEGPSGRRVPPFGGPAPPAHRLANHSQSDGCRHLCKSFHMRYWFVLT